MCFQTLPYEKKLSALGFKWQCSLWSKIISYFCVY